MAAVILAIATTLTAWPTANASDDIEVFNSTNTDTQVIQNTTSASWAFKFTATDSTTVTSVDVFVYPFGSFDYADYSVQFATGSSTGSFATFTPSTLERDLTCAGYSCMKVTADGSASLTAGNDYWLWVDSSASLSIDFFGGAGATTEGLALGHTFATEDLYESFGGGRFRDSKDWGYPWVQMFTSSGGQNSGDSSGSSGQSSGSLGRTVQISLNASADSGCEGDAVSGVVGTWIELPAASECRPPNASDAAALLGWATDTDFPVAIAQRQVDNGWGAYETKDESGQLTGVFIPAGGSTLLTNDTNLYPIWSN